MAVEFGVGALIWAAGMFVLAAMYQLSTSADDVADAAAQASRAASLSAAPQDAVRAATDLAHQRLATGACDPASVTVAVDVRDFRAGGQVSVTVTCRNRPRIGRPHTFSATSDEVIDTFRGGL